jgi:hypothetical protein
MFSQHKGGYLKRVKLPEHNDYEIDVEVSGGRIKKYEMVDIDSVEDT